MAKPRQTAMSDRQLELAGAATQPEVARSAPRAERPPMILELGPRDFSVLTWVRDEGDAPVYRVAKDRIKAASTAAVLARKLAQKQHARP